MRTRLILGIVVVVLVAFVGLMSFNFLMSKLHSPSMSKTKSSAVINGHLFSITIAKTEKEKEIGLSNTSTLAKDQGMIFIFDKPDYYAFWMRNMKYPLDIIYISKGKIVSIAENVKNPNNPSIPLPVYRPSQVVDTVLEINGGLSESYHFTPGSNVSVSL